MCQNCKKIGIECKYFINERVSRGRRKSSKDIKEMLEKRSESGGSGGSSLDRDDETGDVSHSSEDSPEKIRDHYLQQDSPYLSSDAGAKLSLNMTPGAMFQPDIALLQTPIQNNINNITNNYFNTNYGANNPNPVDDLYSFNLSLFTFAPPNEACVRSPASIIALRLDEGKLKPDKAKVEDMPPTKPPPLATNFVDSPTALGPLITNIGQKNIQPDNPGLHNSLNAYSSNPATTINYLYGTNTYYDNENLLTDLITHLPTSRDRSYELMDRYVTSVHILLPLIPNLSDFLKEHDRFWDLFDPYKNPKSSTSSTSSANENLDFNLLPFYSLYLPVLYASTISEFEEYDNLLLNQDINKYLKGFNKICQYYNYPHGLKTITLLLGNVIVQSTSPNPLTMEMSQIIRYAKFLQLHKDPVILLRIADWKVVKFRRMIWWVIFGLDALSSHNFCLPPVCKFDDFNVVMPEDEDPVFDEHGTLTKKNLNVTVLAMNVKFKYDRILSELVYMLHNGLSNNITQEEINEIKMMIVGLFHFIHKTIIRINNYYEVSPPTTVQEMNLLNFVKNHSWSFVDRATMLLHKKILLRDSEAGSDRSSKNAEVKDLRNEKSGPLSLSQFEDTFGRIQEKNIIRNFDNSSISQLRFNQHELFTYENLNNNLIPSILHNLNDFLKYNDFIKFGKFNWYIKRTIPLDLIILLFVIICVKFKYEFMAVNELVVYTQLINKALFILNRKYFKNEKYKRMLSLTNATWEFIIKKYNVMKIVSSSGSKKGRMEFFDHQVTGYLNMSELFNVMDVPQPALISNGVNLGSIQHQDNSSATIKDSQRWEAEDSEFESPDSKSSGVQSVFSNQLVLQADEAREDDPHANKLEIMQLNEKIYYDLRNNFVDINDYCTFYLSLENVLHELMDYINQRAH